MIWQAYIWVKKKNIEMMAEIDWLVSACDVYWSRASEQVVRGLLNIISYLIKNDEGIMAKIQLHIH